MKTPVRHFIRRFGFVSLFLFAALFWATGCATSRPDPLAGWTRLYGREHAQWGNALKSDYQDYIQRLPQEEKDAVGPIFLYEDAFGQHAVRFMIGLDNTFWGHVLIYDNNNKRIRVIKYVYGHYRS